MPDQDCLVVKDYPVVVECAKIEHMGNVANACHFLHILEGGDELAIAATPERACDFLTNMILSGEGQVYCALQYGDKGEEWLGCIVIQYEGIQGSMRDTSMIVGGFYCAEKAPRGTAILLMYVAALQGRLAGKPNVFMLAGTERNQKRKTYAALGFVDSGLTAGGKPVLYTRLAQAGPALARRLGLEWEAAGQKTGSQKTDYQNKTDYQKQNDWKRGRHRGINR